MQIPSRKLALAVAVLLAVAIAPLRASSQTQQATVTLVAPASVSSSNDHVDVQVNVANAQNLAGFQFVLGVDSHLLKVVSVAKTAFLTQSGRELYCDAPAIEPSAVRFACVTLRMTPAGVDGSGTLAVVTLKPLHSGTSKLTLTRVELVHPDGSDLPSASVDGSLSLSGSGNAWLEPWRIAAMAGGAVVVLVVLGALAWAVRRRRQSPPDQDPGSLTIEP